MWEHSKFIVMWWLCQPKFLLNIFCILQSEYWLRRNVAETLLQKYLSPTTRESRHVFLWIHIGLCIYIDLNIKALCSWFYHHNNVINVMEMRLRKWVRVFRWGKQQKPELLSIYQLSHTQLPIRDNKARIHVSVLFSWFGHNGHYADNADRHVFLLLSFKSMIVNLLLWFDLMWEGVPIS